MPHPGETVMAGPMTGAAERRTKRAGLTAQLSSKELNAEEEARRERK
jgi:hypothetical protein